MGRSIRIPSEKRLKRYSRAPREEKRTSPSAISTSTHLKTEISTLNKIGRKDHQVLSKDLVLRVIIAKLDSSKICDWHELSLDLGTLGKTIEKTVKGKQEKSLIAWSGSELHEIYHNVSHILSMTARILIVAQSILPALKSGHLPWIPSRSPSPEHLPRLCQALLPEVGPDEDGSDEETLVSEEEMTRVSRSRKAKLNAVVKMTAEEEVDLEDDGEDRTMFEESESTI